MSEIFCLFASSGNYNSTKDDNGNRERNKFLKIHIFDQVCRQKSSNIVKDCVLNRGEQLFTSAGHIADIFQNNLKLKKYHSRAVYELWADAAPSYNRIKFVKTYLS